MAYDLIMTSKGEFSREYLLSTYNKVYNVRPVESLSQLQTVCDNLAEHLINKGYKIVFSHSASSDGVQVSVSRAYGYSYYSGLPISLELRKVGSEWLNHYMFLDYTLLSDSFADFRCFSDMTPDVLDILPTQDAIDYLLARDDLINIAGVLSAYKIPSLFFINDSFFKCLEKSWHKLGKHIEHKYPGRRG